MNANLTAGVAAAVRRTLLWGLVVTGVGMTAPALADAPPTPTPSGHEVASLEYLTQGVAPNWSQSGNDLIAFYRRDAAGVNQVYIIRPDGSGEACLTCQAVPGGPPANVHKGQPRWHPSGNYLVMGVEIAGNIFQAYDGGKHRYVTEASSGWCNDIWVVTADGKQWTKLTSFPAYPPGYPKPGGILYPRFSPGGTKLFWTEWIGGQQSLDAPFTYWQLAVADFVVDAKGVRLENKRTLIPGNGVFFESQDWSPDGSKLLFATDIGRSKPLPAYRLDVWEMDVATSALVNLTYSDDEWDEQSSYSPDGAKIAYMSSACCDFNPIDLWSLRTELFLMNADGSGRQQLTHFGSKGHPEYISDKTIVTASSWSADGRRLVVNVDEIAPELRPPHVNQQIWLLTFAPGAPPTLAGEMPSTSTDDDSRNRVMVAVAAVAAALVAAGLIGWRLRRGDAG